MALEEEGRDNIIHERVSLLHEKEYRCFSLSGVRKKWNDVAVTVKNSAGRTLSGSEKTMQETSKKINDKLMPYSIKIFSRCQLLCISQNKQRDQIQKDID